VGKKRNNPFVVLYHFEARFMRAFLLASEPIDNRRFSAYCASHRKDFCLLKAGMQAYSGL